MPSRWDAATHGWSRRVFHYPLPTLDFVQSGGVSKGVEHPAVYSARDFYQFRAGQLDFVQNLDKL